MPGFEIASILVLGGLGWFWLDSLKARDAAIMAARKACSTEDLQLLDDTVSITGLKAARDDDGRLMLQRVYAFEFSDTGDNRRRGSVVLLGHGVSMINLGPRFVPGH
ncbi:MAG: DUF3301 domain-containing protein [Gammaproteobacteria bacterium]|nr:DUF3301 domain-containing protein [Gammaproteobacteria bacterium]MBU1645277.1 DUF3301 domain-containing protein [Gammaproteobacteria bacterium]MBU1971614.1 DUF3301 domain-containing protein [Gammaproteobacteria bacterium]